MAQLTIYFEQGMHRRENNAFSEAHLMRYRDKFQEDVFAVLKALLNGERITYKSALLSGLSGDVRARIHDLRKYCKIPVSDQWIDAGGSRVKEYFMSADDKIQCAEILAKGMIRADRTKKIDQ